MRYYEAETGRFINQDPIGLLGGDNLYQFAPNVQDRVDVFGLARRNKNSKILGRNLTMLPNKANKYTSYHRGYHSWYNKAVEAELDYINAKYTTRADKVRAVENLQRS